MHGRYSYFLHGLSLSSLKHSTYLISVVLFVNRGLQSLFSLCFSFLISVELSLFYFSVSALELVQQCKFSNCEVKLAALGSVQLVLHYWVFLKIRENPKFQYKLPRLCLIFARLVSVSLIDFFPALCIIK
jgi:hypothetical protein